MSARPLAVDRLLAAYNAVLAGVWIGFADRSPVAGGILLAHAAAVGLPLLLQRWSLRPGAGRSGCVRLLVEIYPLLWLMAFWTELGLLHDLRPPLTQDAVVSRLDLAVFGFHPNLVWMFRWPEAWLSELMHFCYFAYYPLIFLPPLVLLATGRHIAARDVIFRLLATYTACYVVYLVFPVIGPGHSAPAAPASVSAGLFYHLTHGAKRLGDSLGTAFPSSHVAGAVTIAVVAWRWFSRPLAVLLALETLGVLLSTVYTGSHFAIDGVAGLLVAFGLQLVLLPAWQAWQPRNRLPAPDLSLEGAPSGGGR